MKLTNKKIDNLSKIVGLSILGFVLLIVILCLIFYIGLNQLEKKERGFVW
jgi:hypothetical protein